MARGRIKEREYVNTSLNLDKELYSRLEKYMEENKIPTKVKVVEDALRHYFSLKECGRCGALNHPQSKICAVCGEKMGEYARVHTQIEEVYNDIWNILVDMRKRYSSCLAASQIVEKEVPLHSFGFGDAVPPSNGAMTHLHIQLLDIGDFLYFLSEEAITTEDKEVWDNLVNEWENNDMVIGESESLEIGKGLNETHLYLAGIIVDQSLSDIEEILQNLEKYLSAISLKKRELVGIEFTYQAMEKWVIEKEKNGGNDADTTKKP